ncbi:hypothetical protein [Neisseria elongata]
MFYHRVIVGKSGVRLHEYGQPHKNQTARKDKYDRNQPTVRKKTFPFHRLMTDMGSNPPTRLQDFGGNFPFQPAVVFSRENDKGERKDGNCIQPAEPQGGIQDIYGRTGKIRKEQYAKQYGIKPAEQHGCTNMTDISAQAAGIHCHTGQNAP